MADPTKNSRTRQKNFRTLILLGIMGVATAVAWWMTTGPGGQRIREARQILAEVRQKRLEAYWGEEPDRTTVQWSILRAKDVPVGWSVTYRRRIPGGFEGGMIQLASSSRGASQAVSHWKLSSDARRGVYQSTSSILGQPAGSPDENATRIELTDGKLDVIQREGRSLYHSSASAPRNYIPEGTVMLIMQLVARRKTQAEFQLIIDSNLPTSRQTAFAKYIVRYLGPIDDDDKNAAGSAVELTMTARQGRSCRVLHFDRDGKLIRQIYGDVTELVVSEDEIREVFPRAVEMLPDSIIGH
jgi:hypothetical protein